MAAGALQEALAAFRDAQQPETGAMFILACREIREEFIQNIGGEDEEASISSIEGKQQQPILMGLNPENEDVIAVFECYGQYQRKLVHLCMDSQPFSD